MEGSHAVVAPALSDASDDSMAQFRSADYGAGHVGPRAAVIRPSANVGAALDLRQQDQGVAPVPDSAGHG